jgi:hypothetical protein
MFGVQQATTQRRQMTSPEVLGRLYLPVLAAIAVIGVVFIFIVGLIHLWPYALGRGGAPRGPPSDAGIST